VCAILGLKHDPLTYCMHSAVTMFVNKKEFMLRIEYINIKMEMNAVRREGADRFTGLPL
jgi:hypothetical protein